MKGRKSKEAMIDEMLRMTAKDFDNGFVKGFVGDKTEYLLGCSKDMNDMSWQDLYDMYKSYRADGLLE